MSKDTILNPQRDAMAQNGQKPENEIIDWLTLERIPRVGPLTIARLINAFESPGAALAADYRDIMVRTGLKEKIARVVAGFKAAPDEIARDLRILEKLGARIVTRWDKDYPFNLKQIYDPPAVMFVRGEILPVDEKAVAVVGTRNPTRYGIEMTEKIVKDLIQAGVTLVSGLARGIDTACHGAALKEGGRTIGVVGCGIDVRYPRENGPLIEEMASRGVVISEFRPGVPPLATNFYRRNRIISGISKGVLVVEAARNSGSLITASHALDQNREVFAVPGSVLNKRTEGPHHLLKQGAGLVESGRDLIQALFEPPQAMAQPSLCSVGEQDQGQDLPEESRELLESLDPDPVSIDLLCESLKTEAGKISALLLDLELRGLVRRHPGNMFSRVFCS